MLITLIGPTAVGKTSISLYIAEELSSEIISCDSRQFYKELKIGTAVPQQDILNKIQHHFIGHVSIHKHYTAGDFAADALKTLDKLFICYPEVILVGGSGLYEQALTQGLNYFPKVSLDVQIKLQKEFEEKGIRWLQKELENFDPVYYKKVDIYNPRRMIRALGVIRTSGKRFSDFRLDMKSRRNFRVIKIGLYLPREFLYLRINTRVDQMIREGLLQEARLYYPYKYLNALKTVGYKELFDHFEGLLTLDQAIDMIKKNTRHYAKHQMTWYRKDPKIIWFLPDKKKEILAYIHSLRNK